MAVNSPIHKNPKRASVAATWNIRLSWLRSDLLACDELSSLASIPVSQENLSPGNCVAATVFPQEIMPLTINVAIS